MSDLSDFRARVQEAKEAGRQAYWEKQESIRRANAEAEDAIQAALERHVPAATAWLEENAPRLIQEALTKDETAQSCYLSGLNDPPGDKIPQGIPLGAFTLASQEMDGILVVIEEHKTGKYVGLQSLMLIWS